MSVDGVRSRGFIGYDVSADQGAAARLYFDGLTNVTIETGDLAGLAIADETVDAVVATLPRDELVAASQRLLYRSHLDGLYRYDDE